MAVQDSYKTTEFQATGLPKAQEQKALMTKPGSCSHNPVSILLFLGHGHSLMEFQLCDYRMSQISAEVVIAFVEAFPHTAWVKSTETTQRTMQTALKGYLPGLLLLPHIKKKSQGELEKDATRKEFSILISPETVLYRLSLKQSQLSSTAQY